MALNKSGLPPMKNPMSAAVRPGGPGTVKPGQGKPLNLGSLGGPKPPKVPGSATKIGSGVPMPNYRGGGGVPTIPKMPKVPRFK